MKKKTHSIFAVITAVFGIVLVSIVAIHSTTMAKEQEQTILFSGIVANGRQPRSEGDEWVEIKNHAGFAISLNGWTITASDNQRYHFPANASIQPNQTCKLYTNLTSATTLGYVPKNGECRFDWGQKAARWNNDGDCGRLYSNTGELVDTLCYSGGDEGTTQYPANRPAPQTPSNPPTYNPAPVQNPPTSSGTQPCPTTGKWPAGCVVGGSTPHQNTSSQQTGQPCPTTGKWPAGCVVGGSTPHQNTSSQQTGQPCPTTGKWPAGCVVGGSTSHQNTTSQQTGQPCPTTGKWPAGCIPNGTPQTSGSSNKCPVSGKWPAGCTP